MKFYIVHLRSVEVLLNKVLYFIIVVPAQPRTQTVMRNTVLDGINNANSLLASSV